MTYKHTYVNFLSVIIIKDTLQRTTIFLTKEQHEGLRTIVFERRKSVSQLLREAALEIMGNTKNLKHAQKSMNSDKELISSADYEVKRNIN